MLKFGFLAAAVLLAACNKYGPGQEVSQSAGKKNVTAVAAAPTKLAPFSAVEYVMPNNVVYTMRCDLNSVGGIGLNPGVPAAVAKAPKVVFNGWIVDENLSVPSEFLILLKGSAATYAISAVAGMDRPDVAEALGASSALPSGYGFEVNIQNVAAGRYEVQLLAPERGSACDSTKILDVIDEVTPSQG